LKRRGLENIRAADVPGVHDVIGTGEKLLCLRPQKPVSIGDQTDAKRARAGSMAAVEPARIGRTLQRSQ